MAEQRDFILSLYEQTSQNLRESDRNRNYFFWVYAAINIAVLGFISPNVPNDNVIKLLLVGGLVFLSLFGVGTAFYITFARKWHCEYSWSIEAIHRCLINKTDNLEQAGEAIKQHHNLPDMNVHYFNVKGTEFIVFMLVLV